MKKVSHAQLSFVGAALLLGACTGEIQPAASPPEADVVFEASYSEHGRFTVMEDGEGRLSMGIIGSSAADDPGQIARKLSRSLVATYRALLPGAKVPAELQRLDVRYLAQHPVGARHADRPAAPLGAVASPALGPTAVIRNTPADRFYKTFCVWRDEGGFETIPDGCWYNAWVHELCFDNEWVDPGYDAYPVNYAQNDGTAWASLHGAGMAIWVPNGSWMLGRPSRTRSTICLTNLTAGPMGVTNSYGQDKT